MMVSNYGISFIRNLLLQIRLENLQLTLRLLLVLIENLLVPCYLILSVLAIASLKWSFLSNLASHGKTRRATSPCVTYQHDSYNIINKSIEYKKERKFKLYFDHCNIFLLRKKRFVDFYKLGISSLTFVFIFYPINRCDGNNGNENGLTEPINELFVFMDILMTWIPTALLFCHLIRRYYECRYVHVWTHGSTMHLAGYIIGLLHYAILPLVVVPSDLFCVVYKGESNLLVENKSQFLAYTFIFFVGVATCIFGQVEQHIHHKILSQCRKGNKEKSDTKYCDFSFSHGYTIPTGRWFRYVSFPHYLSEILIYLSFVLMLHYSLNKYKTSLSWQICNIILLKHNLQYLLSYLLYFISVLRQYKHIALLFWVITNLSVSSLNNYKWYIKNFKSYYPKDRMILFPYFW